MPADPTSHAELSRQRHKLRRRTECLNIWGISIDEFEEICPLSRGKVYFNGMVSIANTCHDWKRVKKEFALARYERLHFRNGRKKDGYTERDVKEVFLALVKANERDVESEEEDNGTRDADLMVDDDGESDEEDGEEGEWDVAGGAGNRGQTAPRAMSVVEEVGDNQMDYAEEEDRFKEEDVVEHDDVVMEESFFKGEDDVEKEDEIEDATEVQKHHDLMDIFAKKAVPGGIDDKTCRWIFYMLNNGQDSEALFEQTCLKHLGTESPLFPQPVKDHEEMKARFDAWWEHVTLWKHNQQMAEDVANNILELLHAIAKEADQAESQSQKRLRWIHGLLKTDKMIHGDEPDHETFTTSLKRRAKKARKEANAWQLANQNVRKCIRAVEGVLHRAT
ncbi:hypothetical protein QBC41DRAFT_338340 [Cercophora samala]|uniref:Uncharacterized protein n=1 Tax=Cercophora samala TaxID=330535 RepID=A0AA40DA42_9PEZI|nr:hypothetical protein QBC41DRAFT_338340 [Cercophora samala]